MKIALAQLNPTVGDLSGNRRLILEATEQAIALGADLVVCPELSICGYPPKDLLLREGFANACDSAVELGRRAGFAISQILTPCIKAICMIELGQAGQAATITRDAIAAAEALLPSWRASSAAVETFRVATLGDCAAAAEAIENSRAMVSKSG